MENKENLEKIQSEDTENLEKSPVENTGELILANGEKVKLKLSFARLYRLRAANKGLYEKYNTIILDGAKDMFDFLQILYTAYVCENIDEIEKCMDFETFMENVPFDMTTLPVQATSLITVKKNRIS